MFYQCHQCAHALSSADTLILVFLNHLQCAPLLATSFLKHFLTFLAFHDMASSWFFFFISISSWSATSSPLSPKCQYFIDFCSQCPSLLPVQTQDTSPTFWLQLSACMLLVSNPSLSLRESSHELQIHKSISSEVSDKHPNSNILRRIHLVLSKPNSLFVFYYREWHHRSPRLGPREVSLPIPLNQVSCQSPQQCHIYHL